MITNASHVAYIILAPVGAVLMATMNGFTIFVFAKKFRLQSFSLILIVNICLCDIFVCVFSNFFYVVNLIHPSYDWTTGNIACKIFKMVTMTTNVAQIFSLCAINGDRMRRLTNISARQWGRKQVLRVLIGIWIASICITIPRPFMFAEKIIKLPGLNETSLVIVNVMCKPIDMGHTSFAASTISLFVLAYAIPATYVIYTTVMAHVFMWHRRRQIHLANMKSKVLKSNHELSLTFNLTAGMFLVVWSPFFILSVADLVSDTYIKDELKSANFDLRCTLLIIGSAKPVIYLICLKRFREALKCNGLFGGGGAGSSTTSSTYNASEDTRTKDRKIQRISMFSFDPNATYSPPLHSSQC